MHNVIIQVGEGPQLQALLECLDVFGFTRIVYPAREYRSKLAGNDGARHHSRRSVYDTAPLMPRGDDGGFAESYLQGKIISRDT